MAKHNNEIEPTAINIISNGTVIQGNIKSNADIRIDGELEGNIQTQGKIVIGASGKVKGEITCKTGDISGKIEGKITAGERLTLKSTSNIKGDLFIKQLAVEPGCMFTGKCKMDSELNAKTEISPKETTK
jgi:cytoskeletal protein CcmA (bactofilin family)